MKRRKKSTAKRALQVVPPKKKVLGLVLGFKIALGTNLEKKTPTTLPA